MDEFFDWRSAPEGDFAVIGDPVEHSLSPQIHLAAFRCNDLPFTYSKIRVPYDDYEKALLHLAELGYRGLNVTLPLKEKAFWWCESVDVTAQSIGAVNALRLQTQEGTNTDAIGFLDTLMEYQIEPPGPAMMLGAGGAARAVAVALANAGFELWIWARNLERAEAFVSDLELEACIIGEPDPTGAELIVNATSAGLRGETLPIAWDKIESSAVAYDLAYGKSLPFLESAAEAGARTIDGIPMLLAQAARTFEWWFDAEAPREVMQAAINLS